MVMQNFDRGKQKLYESGECVCFDPGALTGRYFFNTNLSSFIRCPKGNISNFLKYVVVCGLSARGGDTPIHYLYGYVPPNGVVILKLLI